MHAYKASRKFGKVCPTSLVVWRLLTVAHKKRIHF